MFRLEASPPWLSGAPAYADWYVLNDSTALDPQAKGLGEYLRSRPWRPSAS